VTGDEGIWAAIAVPPNINVAKQNFVNMESSKWKNCEVPLTIGLYSVSRQIELSGVPQI
jgi:hypothetical protein